MRALRLLWMIPLLLLMTTFGYAQEETQPLVVFVVDSDLKTASLTDLGPTGLSNLALIFRGLGAQVDYTDLNNPIADDVQVLVLARPLGSFSIVQVVHLWMYLQKGHNLLLAVDPEGYFLGSANVNPQVARSGLTTLLNAEYGIALRDSFLVEPWFTSETIVDLNNTFSPTFADVVSHPVIAPLAAHDLPVWVWGARSVRVEPFGIDSRAVPLLYSNNGYGESNPGVFRKLRGRNNYNLPTAPLEVNIGSDYLGWLNFAALGENTGTGSRIVMLGDSEMIENGYGLAENRDTPRYSGNRIFAERAAAWLLDISPSQWPALPQGFTWIAIDGTASDWSTSANVAVDEPDSTENTAYDIQQVAAFRDDTYAYLLVETSSTPDRTSHVELQVDVDNDGTPDHTIMAQVESVIALSDAETTVIPDGKMAVRGIIELRLPRRLVEPTMINVCIADQGGTRDCLDQVISPAAVDTRAPADLGLSQGIFVTISANAPVNLRAGPSTGTTIITTLPDGMRFAALGRNEDATWINVQNAAYSGWLSNTVVVANGDLSSLPVLTEESP
jgi:hypothetical protein